jgi:transposase
MSMRGRRPDPACEQRWRDRLVRFHRSGLTVAAFCDRESVSTAAFYQWQRRLDDSIVPPAPAAPAFVTVALAETPTPPVIEVALASGHVVRIPPGFDPAHLRAVLTLLAEGGTC